MAEKKVHQGRNIKRFREMLGIKQEALAWELEERSSGEWNQQKISLLEQRETIEDNVLKQIAQVLKLPLEAIQNFDEEQAISIIANTINNNDHAVMHGPSMYSYQPTFNPLDKMVELYERMLTQQKEIIEKLEHLLEKR